MSRESRCRGASALAVGVEIALVDPHRAPREKREFPGQPQSFDLARRHAEPLGRFALQK